VGKSLFFFHVLPCHESKSSSFSIPFFPYILQANRHYLFYYCLQINSLKALPLSSAYSRTTFLRLGSSLTYTSNPRKWPGQAAKFDNVCCVVHCRFARRARPSCTIIERRSPRSSCVARSPAGIYHHGGRAGISSRVFDSVPYNLVFVPEYISDAFMDKLAVNCELFCLPRKDSLKTLLMLDRRLQFSSED